MNKKKWVNNPIVNTTKELNHNLNPSPNPVIIELLPDSLVITVVSLENTMAKQVEPKAVIHPTLFFEWLNRLKEKITD